MPKSAVLDQTFNWENDTPPATAWEDTVIYEGHIRDFSILDASTSAANRGKYLAFTESDTAPVMHLQELAAAGVTHFHVLPANDIATINEDVAEQLSLDSTVGELCVATGASASICDGRDPNLVLGDIMAGFDPDSADAQDLILAAALAYIGLANLDRIRLSAWAHGEAARLTFHSGNDRWPDIFIPVK